MLRATLLALVPLASTFWSRPADACSCQPQNLIVHPAGDSIAETDGLIGRLVFVATPTISVTYVDDPTHTPIPGTFRTLLGYVTTIWTFVPDAPLVVDRTVRAEIRGSGGVAPPLSRDFLVRSSSVASAPDFGGITGMRAVLTRFQNEAGGSCGPGPEQSRVALAGLPAPSATAPMYRYFFYRQGTPPPTEPTTYGVTGHFISEVRCGNPSLRCERDLPMNFQVGETWCARVEATDLMGHRSGYDAEACATVELEEVDLIDFGGMVSCTPHVAPDGGVAITDGGPSDGGTSPDAGTDASEKSDGCTCIAPAKGKAPLGIMGLLGIGVLLGRRRRNHL